MTPGAGHLGGGPKLRFFGVLSRGGVAIEPRKTVSLEARR